MWGTNTCYVFPSIGGTPRSRKLCSHECAHLSRPPTELCPPSPGVFLVQSGLCLEGLQPRCTTRRCHFWVFPACNTSAGQARERLPSIPGQETKRNKFWKAKSDLAIDTCSTLENTPRYHTPLLLLPPDLCVVGTIPRSSSSSSSGNRGGLASIPAAAFHGSVPFLRSGTRTSLVTFSG